ncbi:uncharacterized protein LOC121864274 [Homarus americanus]|uniref:uncharacterized protein LOC121864274 n=1 Tax=Homarus americanus TaxID=6706 RepID=UPI001C4509C3|nr:uncharacterized protein LOC121864274 [Homarus americanus]
MVRGGPSLADRLIFLLTLLFLNTEGCCQLSSSWTNSCDGQIMFKQHMFCYKYYECVSSSWTEKSCSPGTYWMSDTQPCGSTTCFGTGSFEAETQGTGYTIRGMEGVTSDMGHGRYNK